METRHLVGRDGNARNLVPARSRNIDAVLESGRNYIADEKAGCYLYVGRTGNLVARLVGDTAFTTFELPDYYDVRLAIAEVSSTTTCRGIVALY